MKITAQNITRLCILLLPCFLFFYCQNEFQSAAVANVEQYKNLAPDTKYLGMQTCRSCHDNIHKTFIHTGMGRSFDRATLEKTDATLFWILSTLGIIVFTIIGFYCWKKLKQQPGGGH